MAVNIEFEKELKKLEMEMKEHKKKLVKAILCAIVGISGLVLGTLWFGWKIMAVVTLLWWAFNLDQDIK